MIRARFPSLRPLFDRFQRPDQESISRAAPAPGAGERRLSERRGNVIDRQHREFRLHAVTQAAGIGVYDIDCVGGRIYWSPELKVIAGLAEPGQGAFFDPWARLVHPADRERVLGKFRAALLPGGPEKFEDEHRLLRPDGSLRWVRIHGQTFFSDEGEQRRPWGASGVVQDITAEKEAEQGLLESGRREAEFEGLIAALLQSLIATGAPTPLRIECRIGRGELNVAIGDDGSGVGLAAGRRIAGHCGGRLLIDPETGMVTVSIPRKPAGIAEIP